ncbi:hypothetical protein GCM10010317_008590 [Streptomyces mirabilis]|nr:hypothetical protein GCM10010317_008590 [Streptomyces mirabilis]
MPSTDNQRRECCDTAIGCLCCVAAHAWSDVYRAGRGGDHLYVRRGDHDVDGRLWLRVTEYLANAGSTLETRVG